MLSLKKSVAAVLAAAALTIGIAPAAASADQAAATRNEILAGAALIAGIAISANVAHKQAQANSVVGYTPNGSTVYADGRVVSPNGQTYYPGNNGASTSCDGNGNCSIAGMNGYGYNGYGYNGYQGHARRAYGYAH